MCRFNCAALVFAIMGVLATGIQAAGIVRGVNLGGWLVTEPWMTPSLFNSTATDDEWHLCNVLGKSTCLSTLDNHWSTFYTRDDFVEIKQAGLTAVRIPLGYWAVVDVLEDYEPYVSGQYPYLIRAVQWAGELGLQVMIDIHGAPGSQNGWEETGLVGPVGFMDNTTNTDRTLSVLQNLTTEFSKSEYLGVVTNIELLNEPLLGLDVLKTFYTLGANIVNAANVSGINVTINDGFYEPHTWANYDPNNADAQSPAPSLTIDTHQFWAFAPYLNLTADEVLADVCTFGQQVKQMANISGIPPTLVGEWSLSTGITANSTTDASEDVDKRTWFRTLFEAQNAAFTPNTGGQSSIGWYFWAWKTEYDIDAWSYRKGIANQYIPSNISDPSTYFYPIRSDGCIDMSEKNYTSPATVTSAGGSSPTGSPTASGQAGASDKKSAASPSRQIGADAGRTALFLMFSFAVFCI
jgi:glucan 1,3-beta-glucosidase